jgi:hypothetical protein
MVVLFSGCVALETTDALLQEEDTGMNTSEINLKHYDDVSEKLSIDTIFEEMESYSSNAGEFLFKDTYSNFELISSGVDDAGIYAYYNLKHDESKKSYDVDIRLSIEKTQSDAKECLKDFVFSTTTRNLYPSTAVGIVVGDLAIGDTGRLTYIRGNVYVDIISNKGAEIVDLAREIDRQILDILNENHDTKSQ